MIKCPANYFGKGVDYILPDDIEIIREFEKKWDEWCQAHPEDPTGELTLKALVPKRDQSVDHNEEISVPHPVHRGRNAKGVFVPKDGSPPTRTFHAPDPNVMDLSDEFSEIKLRLPTEAMELLKNYATFLRRRPRDIVLKWIRMHCTLTKPDHLAHE